MSLFDPSEENQRQVYDPEAPITGTAAQEFLRAIQMAQTGLMGPPILAPAELIYIDPLMDVVLGDPGDITREGADDPFGRLEQDIEGNLIFVQDPSDILLPPLVGPRPEEDQSGGGGGGDPESAAEAEAAEQEEIVDINQEDTTAVIGEDIDNDIEEQPYEFFKVINGVVYQTDLITGNLVLSDPSFYEGYLGENPENGSYTDQGVLIEEEVTVLEEEETTQQETVPIVPTQPTQPTESTVPVESEAAVETTEATEATGEVGETGAEGGDGTAVVGGEDPGEGAGNGTGTGTGTGTGVGAGIGVGIGAGIGAGIGDGAGGTTAATGMMQPKAPSFNPLLASIDYQPVQVQQAIAPPQKDYMRELDGMLLRLAKGRNA